jgi:hypothetical protein
MEKDIEESIMAKGQLVRRRRQSEYKVSKQRLTREWWAQRQSGIGVHNACDLKILLGLMKLGGGLRMPLLSSCQKAEGGWKFLPNRGDPGPKYCTAMVREVPISRHLHGGALRQARTEG